MLRLDVQQDTERDLTHSTPLTLSIFGNKPGASRSLLVEP